jgi:hypothetical protein
MAVSTTCIFSLLFKDRVRQQVQWRMEEKSPIFARTYNNTNPSTHDASNAYDRSKPKRLGRWTASLSTASLPWFGRSRFEHIWTGSSACVLSHHGEPISVYRHVGATYNVCSTLP